MMCASTKAPLTDKMNRGAMAVNCHVFVQMPNKDFISAGKDVLQWNSPLATIVTGKTQHQANVADSPSVLLRLLSLDILRIRFIHCCTFFFVPFFLLKIM